MIEYQTQITYNITGHNSIATFQLPDSFHTIKFSWRKNKSKKVFPTQKYAKQ